MATLLLDGYLDLCRSKRFSWCEWNCVYFIAGWVLAVEGLDILPAYTEETNTPRSAVRLARSLGGLKQAISTALNRQPVPILQACVGDVVYSSSVFDDGAAGTLAICNGATAVAVSTTVGIVPVPMGAFTTAWKLNRETV